MPRTKLVDIRKLIFDPDYYPRAFADYRTVAKYRTAMEAGNKFPPLVVVSYNGGFLILDGVHRFQAYKKTELKKIPVKVEDVPEDMWLPTATMLNAKNARAFTVTEQTGLVHRFRDGGFTDQQISGFLFTDEDWVYRLAELAVDRRSNGDIEHIALKHALQEVSSLVQSKIDDPKQNFNLKAIQRNMSGQSQAKMIEQIVHLVEDDLLNLESEHVQIWLARLKTALCS